MKTFGKYVEILRHANFNMDKQDFVKFVLNRWRDTQDNFDCYTDEKFQRFQENSLMWIGTLSGKAYWETLQGFLDWYTINYKDIDERCRANEARRNKWAT